MEIYILDSLLRRVLVVDRFESLIWTERFSSYGDFELSVHSTFENRSIFVTGARLATNKSYRVMTIETIENHVDSDGKATLTLKGHSLETLLDDRVARDTMATLKVEPKWVLTGTPGGIARKIFNDICVVGLLNIGDVIPFMTPGTIFPADTLIESPDVITLEIDLSTVYEAVKKVCDLYDLGFRLIRNFDTSQLYFNVYAGSDRTTQQTLLPPVIFAPDMDNLQNTTELTTTDAYKNVAYVFSPQGSVMVYPVTIDPEVEGFERHVLMVNVTDITVEVSDTLEEIDAKKKETKASNLESEAVTTTEIANAATARNEATVARNAADISMAIVELSAITPLLQQRGAEELSKTRKFSAFDGELNQSNSYKYNLDYNLGDLVEMRNSDGFTNNMRVTEQIFVSDREGERSYPTLSVDVFINPGSWLSWEYNRIWQEMGATEYWENA